MAEALGVTASVIAVAALAWESTKKLYELVDKLRDVPKAIMHTKSNLSTAQSAIDTLKQDLATGDAAMFDAVLQRFRMTEALEWSRKECDLFRQKIETYIKHSKDGTFSKRDRFIVSLHESEINQFNRRLRDHQQLLTLVTTSMNLIISKTSSTDFQQLSERFARQETELKALNTQLNQTQSDLQTVSISNPPNESAAATEDREWSVNSIRGLQSICQGALSATSDANPIKQQFGDVTADNSRYYEGVAGKSQGNVTQVHGKAVVTGGSTAARGQMDADAFKIMFGSR